MFVAHPDSPDAVYDMVLLETGSRREAERAVGRMMRDAAVNGMSFKMGDTLARKMARLI